MLSILTPTQKGSTDLCLCPESARVPGSWQKASAMRWREGHKRGAGANLKVRWEELFGQSHQHRLMCVHSHVWMGKWCMQYPCGLCKIKGSELCSLTFLFLLGGKGYMECACCLFLFVMRNGNNNYFSDKITCTHLPGSKSCCLEHRMTDLTKHAQEGWAEKLQYLKD